MNLIEFNIENIQEYINEGFDLLNFELNNIIKKSTKPNENEIDFIYLFGCFICQS
jgi:hypothetical protein